MMPDPISSPGSPTEREALEAAWARRCLGRETIQSAPLALLFVILACEICGGNRRTGNLVTDMLESCIVILQRMRREDTQGGCIDCGDLGEIELRLDITRELQRRAQKAGA